MTMTTASLPAHAQDGVVEEHDPAARPRRRSFTAEYKEQILDEYDGLPAGSSERGALLRREGSTPLTSRSGARPVPPAPATAWPQAQGEAFAGAGRA